MQIKIQQSVISGMVATIAMGFLMAIGAAIGMPKMSPPNVLARIMEVPVSIGWVIHFMIGIVFAAAYVFLFNNWLKEIFGKVLRGAVYGIVAFIVAKISFPVLAAIFDDAGMAEPEGSMALLIIGSIIGHVVFGIVIALLVKPLNHLQKIV